MPKQFRFPTSSIHTIQSSNVPSVRTRGDDDRIIVKVPDEITLVKDPYVEAGILYITGKRGDNRIHGGVVIQAGAGGMTNTPNMVTIEVPPGKRVNSISRM